MTPTISAARSLVIVEPAAKAKTIKRTLGPGARVTASDVPH
jgi:DNA topoisomerase IA